MKECVICNEKRYVSFFSYRCPEHDVCDVCKKKRKDIIGVPWVTKTGFICDECKKRSKKAILDFQKKPSHKTYFFFHDKIKCPYCGYEYATDFYESTNEEECPNCNSLIEVEVTVTYSTNLIGVSG